MTGAVAVPKCGPDPKFLSPGRGANLTTNDSGRWRPSGGRLVGCPAAVGAAGGGDVAGEQAAGAAAGHADGGGGTGQPDRITNRERLDQADGRRPAWVVSP